MPYPIYHENMSEIEFSTLAELFSIFMDRDSWKVHNSSIASSYVRLTKVLVISVKRKFTKLICIISIWQAKFWFNKNVDISFLNVVIISHIIYEEVEPEVERSNILKEGCCRSVTLLKAQGLLVFLVCSFHF